MLGGFGNDTYVVDNAGDMPIEEAGAGIDRVNSSISFSLNTATRANIEHLTLTAAAGIGIGNALANQILGNNVANNLQGLAGDDFLFGGGANDVLSGGFGNDVHNGGIGADNMQGGFGNDTYFIDNGADFVFEAAGAGIDRIVSSINLTLNTVPRANVENLSLSGAAAFGQGNALGNSIVGTNFANNLQGLGGNDNLAGLGGNDLLLGGVGNDVHNGGLGADNMQGGIGNDSYIVDNAGDFVFEAAASGFDSILSSISLTLNVAARANVENLSLSGAAFFGQGNALGNTIVGTNLGNNLQGLGGNDRIFGLAGNDTLLGGTGSDLLDGGPGADLLNGGGFGNDLFQFSAALGAVDLVQDFSPSAAGNNDVILLDDDVFLGVGPLGTLAVTAFADGPATTAAHRILYNEVTGAISFDRDGTNAVFAPVQFATLLTSPNDVTNLDFVVIA